MSFEYGLSNKNKTTSNYNGFGYTKKQSIKTTVHWTCRYVKQFGCKATTITCWDTIIKFPKENCCRYVSGEVEARKIVAAVKPLLYTLVYWRDCHEISEFLWKIMCSVIDAQKNLITRALNCHRQKNIMNDLPILPHTKNSKYPKISKIF